MWSGTASNIQVKCWIRQFACCLMVGTASLPAEGRSPSFCPSAEKSNTRDKVGVATCSSLQVHSITCFANNSSNEFWSTEGVHLTEHHEDVLDEHHTDTHLQL